MASGFVPGSAVCPAAIPFTNESAKNKTAICAISFLSIDFMYFLRTKGLCIDAALTNRVSHTIDGQHVGGDSVVDVVRLGVADDIFKRRLHDGVELLVHHRFLPEVSLAVLHPLEIRGGDAARIGQNVGDHEDALIGE